MIQAVEHKDPKTWNRVIRQLPGAHILQSREWGVIKGQFGWQAIRLVWEEDHSPVAALQILERSLATRVSGLRMLYAPKGPLLDWSREDLRRQVLADLADLAHRHGAMYVKIDPDVPLGTGVPGSPEATSHPLGAAVQADLQKAGWRFSAQQVQFRNTVTIDLSLPEEDLLAGMKQKTRYNVRLAGRRGVVVRPAGEPDLEALFRLYAETAARDRFVIRPQAYYLTAWRTFLAAGWADPLIAEVAGEPVAGVIPVHFARRAWFLYGMSGQRHREKMPGYLLQWEAIRRARTAGCLSYDMWGAPDRFEESDPLWGVYRFKQGFPGVVVRYLGAWDLPIRPLLYQMNTLLLPRLLAVMRRRTLAPAASPS